MAIRCNFFILDPIWFAFVASEPIQESNFNHWTIFLMIPFKKDNDMIQKSVSCRFNSLWWIITMINHVNHGASWISCLNRALDDISAITHGKVVKCRWLPIIHICPFSPYYKPGRIIGPTLRWPSLRTQLNSDYCIFASFVTINCIGKINSTLITITLSIPNLFTRCRWQHLSQ